MRPLGGKSSFRLKIKRPSINLMSNGSHIYPIVWQNDHLLLIDQTRLPREFSLIEIRRYKDLIEAVQRGMMPSRPIIEVAAAYGLYLGIQNLDGNDRTELLEQLERVSEELQNNLPRKVNLRQEMNQLLQKVHDREGGPAELKAALLEAAQAIHLANLQMCYRIGNAGVSALPAEPTQLGILTYANPGALATTGYGTALGIIRSAQEQNRLAKVYVAETRPGFEGAKLTAWECVQEGIPVSVMTDAMAAWAMQQGLIHAVVVGAEAIAANGDTLNWVGTYGLALAAQAHQIPFLVAAPLETVKFDKAIGSQLPLRTVEVQTLTQLGDLVIYPTGVEVYNPCFDITPATCITAIITEQGVFDPGDLVQGSTQRSA